MEMHQLRAETELKLSAKEGQKLWANFRSYAKYDELKELYRKTLPALSSFEDKLKENNDFNERIEGVMQRLDEVLCSKADRTSVKEFKDYCAEEFITRKDNSKFGDNVDNRIVEFNARMVEIENLVRFQAK